VTDQSAPIADQQAPGLVPQPPSPDGSSPPQPLASPFDDRPELAVGAAFAGGLLAALILRRLAR
jgi:hypothetical protein